MSEISKEQNAGNIMLEQLKAMIQYGENKRITDGHYDKELGAGGQVHQRHLCRQKDGEYYCVQGHSLCGQAACGGSSLESASEFCC